MCRERTCARSPSVTFMFCPAAHRIAKPYSNRATSLRTLHNADRGEQAGLSEAPRPRLRVRPGVGRVVLTVEGGRVTRAPDRAGWCGNKAMAIPEAEAALVGGPVNQANCRKAAEAALHDQTTE